MKRSSDAKRSADRRPTIIEVGCICKQPFSCVQISGSRIDWCFLKSRWGRVYIREMAIIREFQA